jgi:hypothetical protein
MHICRCFVSRASFARRWINTFCRSQLPFRKTVLHIGEWMRSLYPNRCFVPKASFACQWMNNRTHSLYRNMCLVLKARSACRWINEWINVFFLWQYMFGCESEVCMSMNDQMRSFYPNGCFVSNKSFASRAMNECIFSIRTNVSFRKQALYVDEWTND